MGTSSEAEPDELYRRLGLRRQATRDEIVHAYRRLAPGAHPDTQPGDPDASRRFRELTEAYEVLGDPVRRASYDRPPHRPTPKAAVQVPCSPIHLGPTITSSGPALRPVPWPMAPLWAAPVHIEPDVTSRDQHCTDPLAAAFLALLWQLASPRWQ